MKSYTDIGQSKKLAEILPLESADMCFANDGTSTKIDANPYNIRKLMWEDVQVIPCWSLSALLGLMPFQLIANNNRFGFYQVKGFNKQGETYRFGYKTNNNSFLFETSWYNDVIDAAFEMVVWLKEKRKVMIYEDYCSFEVYKLLKEKGFDGETHTTFDKEGYTQPSITHQMAMKWLRKEHNILLFLLPAQENGKLVYLVEVWTLNEEEGIYESTYAPMPRKEPEQAVEAALKYCLENLIKTMIS